MKRSIESVKGSLFVRVFFLTSAILFSVGVLTYGLLAWLMPKTYSDRLSLLLRQRAEQLISELEQVTFQERGGLFDQFLQNPEISGIELYDESGFPVPPADREEGTTYVAAEATSEQAYEDAAPLVSDSYYFSFADSGRRYMLLVYGSGQQVAQLRQAFVRVLPVLLAVSFLLALFFAFFYAAVIMQLQNRNRRLAEDIERERAQEQARLDFFSAVSHELKTPVTIVKGQLEGMLLGIGDYKDHGKYLARALEVTNTLEDMVQELLMVSRLEASAVDLRSGRFDAVAVIRDYLNQTEDCIMEKGLHIDCDLPPAAMVVGNQMLLKKVFSNLIGNAVKHSPEGADIHIVVREGQGRFECSVENGGVRIPEACMNKLFEAFYRVERSRNKSFGGSGLGLYIVQKILTLYGSCCEVCNTSTGVRFSFVLEGGEGQDA